MIPLTYFNNMNIQDFLLIRNSFSLSSFSDNPLGPSLCCIHPITVLNRYIPTTCSVYMLAECASRHRQLPLISLQFQ